MSKIDMTARVMRHKTKIYDGILHADWTAEQKWAAQMVLSEVLDMVSEYRE